MVQGQTVNLQQKADLGAGESRRSAAVDANRAGAGARTWLKTVRERVAEAKAACAGSDARTYVCVTMTVDGPFRSLESLVDDADTDFAVYWRDFTEQATVFASGIAERVIGLGGDRGDDLRLGWRSIRSRLQIQAGDRPRFFAGLSFAAEAERKSPWEDWPDGLLVLPRWVFEQQAEESLRATFCAAVDASTDELAIAEAAVRELETRRDGLLASAIGEAPRPIAAPQSPQPPESSVDDELGDIDATTGNAEKSHFLRSVREAAAAIRRGEYDKVVLARRVTQRLQDRFRPSFAMADLGRRQSSGAVFAVNCAGSLFIGATPERLVSVRTDQVSIDCLAGTAPRGQTLAQDAMLAEDLLHSAKNRREHQWVVEGVERALCDEVDSIRHPEGPQIRKLEHVQHLYTPVTARLKAGRTALDFALKLHPTPAVAGWPIARTLEEIAAREPVARGWYAGTLGILDGDGDGTFVVALRCALIEGNQAHLFAGVGVVGDSDPESELEETEWKFGPMRSVLNAKHLENRRASNG